MVDGFSVDSPNGFAIWLERQGHCIVLSGHRMAQLVFSSGAPYIDVFHVADDGVGTVRDMRVPCVDIIGLAPLGDDVEAHRDHLAEERSARPLH